MKSKILTTNGGAPEFNLKVNLFNSTGDDEIQAVIEVMKTGVLSKYIGAPAPFIRDADLPDNFTPTIPVIRDAIYKLSQISEGDLVTCIYPTSIFITPELLNEASILSNSLSNDNFVVNFTRFSYQIQRALRKSSNGELSFITLENAAVRSQDLEPVFHDDAQFYIAKTSAWNTEESVFNNALGVEFSSKHVLDIDTLEDLENARFILNKLINF